MGTWTAFYVKSDKESVVTTCKTWFATKKRRVSEERGDFPDDFDVRITGQSPRRLLIGETSPGWVEVHYDGFYFPNELAKYVSESHDTTVVDTVAQTTSDAYAITVYESGTERRKLEFSDGDWTAQAGDPLPDEPSPLATKLGGPDEEECYVFELQALTTYCTSVFGIELWRDPRATSDWVDLKTNRGLRRWLGF